ncbi:MAG TPA: ATP-binding protein [Puia sp.]|jgi:signal transduction histidine kinase|nr:ATP-binding protein [Puia sp.]
MQDQNKEVVIFLVAGTFLFLVLGGIVVFVLMFYQQKRFRHSRQLLELQSSTQQELLKTQLETQEATYRQIGEEIHDNVGQLLSTAKILLSITERSLPEVPETLHTATDTIGKAIQDLRSLSRSLSSEWLQQFNIVENLKAEVNRLNTAGIVRTRIEIPTGSLPMTADSQIMLFRVVQEAIQNTLKHADATEVLVTVTLSEAAVEIVIRDNGRGFSPETLSSKGLGLKNMLNRTRLLGGTIDWTSANGNGVEVKIIVPIQPHTI